MQVVAPNRSGEESVNPLTNSQDPGNVPKCRKYAYVVGDLSSISSSRKSHGLAMLTFRERAIFRYRLHYPRSTRPARCQLLDNVSNDTLVSHRDIP